jgi:hypothetical protein
MVLPKINIGRNLLRFAVTLLFGLLATNLMAQFIPVRGTNIGSTTQVTVEAGKPYDYYYIFSNNAIPIDKWDITNGQINSSSCSTISIFDISTALSSQCNMAFDWIWRIEIF